MPTDWYVDVVNGADDNDGETPETAVKTIKTGVLTNLAGSLGAADTIHLAEGTYAEGTIDVSTPDVPDLEWEGEGDGTILFHDTSEVVINIANQSPFVLRSLKVQADATGLVSAVDVTGGAVDDTVLLDDVTLVSASIGLTSNVSAGPLRITSSRIRATVFGIVCEHSADVAVTDTDVFMRGAIAGGTIGIDLGDVTKASLMRVRVRAHVTTATGAHVVTALRVYECDEFEMTDTGLIAESDNAAWDYLMALEATTSLPPVPMTVTTSTRPSRIQGTVALMSGVTADLSGWKVRALKRFILKLDTAGGTTLVTDADTAIEAERRESVIGLVAVPTVIPVTMKRAYGYGLRGRGLGI